LLTKVYAISRVLTLFLINNYELVCPICKGELSLVNGNELFGVLKCSKCRELYPLGNYFPGIPDLRPKALRIEIFEKAWFNLFKINTDKVTKYPKDLDFRINEIPYFVSLLNEECPNEYASELEAQYLNEFKDLIKNLGNVLSLGCGCGRDLKLIGRNKLGIDIFPSNIILANSQGILAILADARKLPFKDNSFDAILAIQSLEYIPIADTLHLINELSRVLKPRGIILLTLEKCSDNIDKEFYYRYKSDYLVVKHFHRCWGIKGLNEIRKHFNVIRLDEDDDYYYVLATNSRKMLSKQ